MKKIIFIMILFFIACSTPQPPKWYINTPKDNSLYFYASAKGYSKDVAIKRALNDIASRINIKISSKFVINKGIYNKKTYNDIYQKINAQVKNINFNNYEILKIKKIDENFYLLLRVNKQKLINNFKIKLDQKLDSINFKQNSNIKKVINSYKVLKKLKEIKSDIFILESLNYNIKNYLHKIKILENTAKNIIQNSFFKLKINKFQLPTYKILSNYLNINSKSHTLITINIKLQKLKLFNNFLIKGKAIIFLDKPYIINFLGNSKISYNDAFILAKNIYIKKLSNLLKKIF